MLSEYEEERLDEALAVLSEHFPNYAVAVLSEGELLHYDYSSWRIGRMLFRDSLEDMGRDMNMMDEMEEWADMPDEWEDGEDYE